MDEMESKTLAIYKLERYTIYTNGADFSISVPVSRNSSPKQGDFCRIFGSFCYFLRRWDLMDQNGLQKNDQYKIWNKIGQKLYCVGAILKNRLKLQTVFGDYLLNGTFLEALVTRKMTARTVST